MEASHLQCRWICGLRLFLWNMSRLRSPQRFWTVCRRHFWFWKKSMFLCLHHYLSWKITFAGGTGMLLDFKLGHMHCQTYLCMWALNPLWQTFARLCVYFWKIHKDRYFQQNLITFEALPFSAAIASAFMQVLRTQKWNRAAI